MGSSLNYICYIEYIRKHLSFNVTYLELRNGQALVKTSFGTDLFVRCIDKQSYNGHVKVGD